MKSKTLTVAALSTRDTNIGDDFIRVGVLDLLHEALSPTETDVTIYNKHTPWELYPSWHPARCAAVMHAVFGGKWRKGHDLLSHLPGNKLLKSDLILQCGTPVIWKQAYACEWAVPFWKMATKRPSNVSLLNLGAGSCYPDSAPPDSLTGRDKEYAIRMVSTSTLTVARDTLAARLLSEASGKDIPVLDCPAFQAGGVYVKSPPTPEDRFLLNVMPGAGHFDFKGEMREGSWEETVNQLVHQLRKDFRVQFICHSEREVTYAQTHWPEHEIVRPGNPEEYFLFAQGAFAAVTNRLHAAVGLAGIGIPAIAVGTDTRLEMTRLIGLPSLFAPDLNVDTLQEAVHSLVKEREIRSARLQARRKEVRSHYLNLLKPVLSSL